MKIEFTKEEAIKKAEDKVFLVIAKKIVEAYYDRSICDKGGVRCVIECDLRELERGNVKRARKIITEEANGKYALYLESLSAL